MSQPRRVLMLVLAGLLAGCTVSINAGDAGTVDDATSAPAEPTAEATTESPTTEATADDPTTEPATEPAAVDLPTEVPVPSDFVTMPPTEDMSDEELAAAIEAYLTPFLIAPQDLGPAWGASPWQPTEGGGLCGVDVDAEHPVFAHVGTVLSPADADLALEQEFRAYATIDAAAAAFERGRESLSCGESTVDPSRGTLTEVIDVTDDVGAPAFAVGVTGEGFSGSVFVALVSDTLASFEFVGATGAAEEFGAPDPTDVTAFGVEKLVTGFENS